jgi:hypothetical protein
MWAVGIGTAAAVVLIAVLLTAISGNSGTSSTTNKNPGSMPEYRAPVAPAVSAPTSTTKMINEPTPLTDPAAARAALESQVAADRTGVEALVGYWVPQLSSKKPGLRVNGTVYDYPAIWQEFVNTRSRYPDVMLLWSGNFSVYQLGDFWVTIKPLPSTDGADANAWCDSQYIPKDDCYAKLISHSHPYAGATLHRVN